MTLIILLFKRVIISTYKCLTRIRNAKLFLMLMMLSKWGDVLKNQRIEIQFKIYAYPQLG